MTEPTPELLALDLRTAENRLKCLATYAVHYSDCPYESWNRRITRCQCGLFALLTQIGFDTNDDKNRACKR